MPWSQQVQIERNRQLLIITHTRCPSWFPSERSPWLTLGSWDVACTGVFAFFPHSILFWKHRLTPRSCLARKCATRQKTPVISGCVDKAPWFFLKILSPGESPHQFPLSLSIDTVRYPGLCDILVTQLGAVGQYERLKFVVGWTIYLTSRKQHLLGRIHGCTISCFIAAENKFAVCYCGEHKG